MKVAIDSGPITGGDSVRGVGVYTENLIKNLRDINELMVETMDVSQGNIYGFDLVHYPFFKPYFTQIPVKKNVKTIVTIHDLIPLIYPKNYPPGLKGSLKLEVDVGVSRERNRS